MKAIANKINYFTPVDDKGRVAGTYYLDQCGNVVKISGMATPVNLPYAVSVNVDNMDDVCTLHISEIENVISTLQNNRKNVIDPIKQAKYDGYIEALNYVVSHNSYIDPWSDYIHDLENELYIDDTE